jgi:hypothetical protein
MNVSVAHLEPAGLLTRRQLWRRYINAFRYGTYTKPLGTIEHRCAEAADRLDRAAEIRAAIASTAQRPALVDDDWFERDEFRRKAGIARSIWAGGE